MRELHFVLRDGLAELVEAVPEDHSFSRSHGVKTNWAVKLLVILDESFFLSLQKSSKILSSLSLFLLLLCFFILSRETPPTILSLDFNVVMTTS